MVFVAGLALGAHAHVGEEPAEQLHVAYGPTPDSMLIAWAGKNPDVSSSDGYRARYGPWGSDPATWAVEYADSRPIGKYLKHRVQIGGLTPGSRYAYECEGPRGQWVNSSFVARRTDIAGWSPRIVMFGDLGYTNDQLLPYLGEEAAAGAIDAIVLFGDMIYWPNGACHRHTSGTAPASLASPPSSCCYCCCCSLRRSACVLYRRERELIHEGCATAERWRLHPLPREPRQWRQRWQFLHLPQRLLHARCCPV